jgi:hypothetical protein
MKTHEGTMKSRPALVPAIVVLIGLLVTVTGGAADAATAKSCKAPRNARLIKSNEHAMLWVRGREDRQRYFGCDDRRGRLWKIVDERSVYMDVTSISLDGSVISYRTYSDDGECLYSEIRARLRLRTGKRKVLSEKIEAGIDGEC